MEEISNTSEGSTQEPEMVPIPEASIEDLNAFIASDKSLDDGEDQEELEPEDKKPEVSAEPKEKEQGLTREQLEAQLKEEREKHEKLRAHAKNVELWNSRQANEIGELRKAIKQAIAEKSKGLDEKFLESPREALRVSKDIEKHEAELAQLDQQEAALAHRQQAVQLVSAHIPEEELDVSAMAEVLASDGIPQDFIKSFVEDPFVQTHGETIIQLHRRAVAEKQRNEAVAIIKKLIAENDRLKKGKRDVLSGVEKASKQMPSVTANNGGAVASSRGTTKSFAQMSEDELTEFLKAHS
jgi:hypothetical protein